MLVSNTTSCAVFPMVRAPLLEKAAPSVNVKVPDAGPLMVVAAVREMVDVHVTAYDPLLDEESKKTVSPATGALAPAAPPVDADQCVVEEVSQVPLPPTQYRVAIFYTCVVTRTTSHRVLSAL